MKRFKFLRGRTSKWKKLFNGWSRKNLTGIFIFNIVILLMVLLSAAGYFKPFFALSINVIVFTGLLLSIFLFNAGSRFMFIFSLSFLFFTAFLRVVGIDIWAERATIYVFDALVIGVVLLIFCKQTYKS